jgi:hypothetical protein
MSWGELPEEDLRRQMWQTVDAAEPCGRLEVANHASHPLRGAYAVLGPRAFGKQTTVATAAGQCQCVSSS